MAKPPDMITLNHLFDMVKVVCFLIPFGNQPRTVTSKNKKKNFEKILKIGKATTV